MTFDIFAITIQSVHLLIYWLVGRLSMSTRLGKPNALSKPRGQVILKGYTRLDRPSRVGYGRHILPTHLFFIYIGK